MRAFLFALALFLTGFAATQSLAAVKPAAAGSEAPVPKKIAPPVPAAPRAQATPVKAKPAPTATPLVTTPLISPMPTDNGDCRLGCAQAYYFCMSNDDADFLRDDLDRLPVRLRARRYALS